MIKYYCGIGSRNVPIKIGNWMSSISSFLEKNKYVLRSGHAKGSDRFFEKGVKDIKNKEIFKECDALPWAYTMVKKYIPKDRPENFDSWSPYVKGLLARNMMQVLGKEGNTPVEFVVCWTPQGDYQTSIVGGTGYAIRCALDYSIPVYNLNYQEQLDAFKIFLKEKFKNG